MNKGGQESSRTNSSTTSKDHVSKEEAHHSDEEEHVHHNASVYGTEDYEYEDDFESFSSEDGTTDSDDSNQDYDSIDGFVQSDSEDEVHIGEHENTDIMIPLGFKMKNLDHGMQLIVPENDQRQLHGDCIVELLSAETRTELFSEINKEGDEILISDAYQIDDHERCFTGNRSKAWLYLPLDLPTTRLDHDDLFTFHVVGELINGDLKDIQSIYMDSKLQFLLKGIKNFFAYAKINQEFIDVTPSGMTFKSNGTTVEIPPGAVDRRATLIIKVLPVNKERMDSYKMDPRSFNRIYALTDILQIRLNMKYRLKRKGYVRLPLDQETRDHEIKCLIKTSDKEDRLSSIVNAKKVIAYHGDAQTSFQVLRVSRGIDEGSLRRDAAYLTGQLDSCTILFYLSKEDTFRYLTVVFVDKHILEKVSQVRWQNGFIEIANSRLCDVDLNGQRRVQVVLGGNIDSVDHLREFMFIYNCRCTQNYIESKISRKQNGLDYSCVKVKFNGRKVHEIRFSYPDENFDLNEIQNTYIAKKGANRRMQAGNLRATTQEMKSRRVNQRMEPRKTNLGMKSRPEAHSPTEGATAHRKIKSRATNPPMESKASNQHNARATYRPRISKAEAHSGIEPGTKLQASKPRERRDNLGVQNRDSPLLGNASLNALGKGLEPEEVNELMLLADFEIHEINKIRSTAEKSYFKPNMKLLEAWTKRMRYEKKLSSNQTLDLLEESLSEIGRLDIANKMQRIRQEEENRIFMSKDFGSC